MTPEALIKRPELIWGPNPFVEEAAEFIPFDELPKKLSRHPLRGKDWKSMPPRFREPLLNQIKQHFVPHRGILVPAGDMQNLYRAGLVCRNPASTEEQARTNRVAMAKTRADLLTIQNLDGGGAIWRAITGMGKTFIAKRVLEVICPRQVIDFGSSKIYGWKSLRQVSYVYVDFSSNGSRGGLLKRVLLALDQVLGTSLSDDFKRVTNIDTLLIEVCRQLSNVRCIMLIIDEKQEKSFDDSPWLLEFVLFYMSLMNLGINVVLLGNPLAFVHLELFSQVMRRFSRGGQHTFLPALSADEDWWQKDFAPRIRKFDVMDRWDVSLDERRKFEINKTAGIPGLLAALHSCTQIEAIRRSGSASEVAVIPADFDAAEKSATYVELRRIALAVSGEGPMEEAAYRDVPAESVAAAAAGTPGVASPSRPSITKAGISHVQHLLGRHMAQQAAKSRKFIERLKSIEGLSEEELRLLGIEEDLLDELRKRTAQSPKKPAAAKQAK